MSTKHPLYFSVGEFVGVQFLTAKTFRENDYESNTFTLCHQQNSAVDPGATISVLCKSRAIGRYVVLTKLRAKSSQFSFSEVEVYGHNPEGNHVSHLSITVLDSIKMGVAGVGRR